MDKRPVNDQIAERLHQICDWLDEWAPYVQFDQHHLDSGTREQAYWNLGYAAALKDAIVLLNLKPGRSGTSTGSPTAEQDE